MGISYKRSYMFYGPPGTGKTSMVLALATEGKRDIYSLDLSKMNSDADLDQAFEQLPDTCLVVLEDIDAMGNTTHSREQKQKVEAPAKVVTPDTIMEALMVAGGAEESRYNNGVSLGALLNHLDGVGSNHGRIFVLTTNHPDVLDPALVRSGRVDMKIYLGLCSREQLRQLFVLYFKGDPDAMDVIPVDILSPADVSSCFQHFRGQPTLAIEELKRRIANVNANVNVYNASKSQFITFA
jgi:chaperone BCS1